MYRSYFGVHAKILTSLQSEMEKLHVLDNLMKMWKRANKLKFFTKEDYMAWVRPFGRIYCWNFNPVYFIIRVKS